MNELPQPTIEFQTQLPEDLPPEQPKKVLYISLIIVAALVFGIIGFFSGRFTAPKPQQNESLTTTNGDWEKLPTGKKGFPVPNHGIGPLTYYSVDEERIITVDDVKVGVSGSGKLGFGSNSPIASPDLLYTALIGEDNNLWIFSHESEEAQQVTSNGFVSHITSWSPDGKSILYYYDFGTIANAGDVIDGPQPETMTFKPQVEKGFYITNIESGETTPLAPVEYVLGFIDNDTILVKADSESSKLIAFNVKTLEADFSRIELEATFGVGQFDFSENADWWTYLLPLNKENPTKGEVRLVLGAYPAEAATVVDSGQWGDIQWPLFSPDNRKIAYEKKTADEEGKKTSHVWVFNIESGERADLVDGEPVLWIGEKFVLIKKHQEEDEDEEKDPEYALLNIDTRRLTNLK